MLIDSHCHLNYPELADTAGVVAREKAVGVGLMQAMSSIDIVAWQGHNTQ